MIQPACGQLVCSVDQVIVYRKKHDSDDKHDHNNDDNEDDNYNEDDDDKYYDNDDDDTACMWSTRLLS